MKIKKSTVKKICNLHEERYDKCYAMLRRLIEKSGRKDWLFIKNCFKKLQGGARIIEDVEAIISQGMNIICFSSSRAKVALIHSVIISISNQ